MTNASSEGGNVQTHAQRALIKELMELSVQLQRKIDSVDDEEHRWMRDNCQSPELARLLPHMTVMELHVLDAIGKLEPVNGITISREFSIPKGSVSKITRRLHDRRLIAKQHLPDNRKEVLFALTEIGRELFVLHRELHVKINEGVFRFLSRYELGELELLMRVLRDMLGVSWISPDNGQDINPEFRK